jgi:hypothetical protein
MACRCGFCWSNSLWIFDSKSYQIMKLIKKQ